MQCLDVQVQDVLLLFTDLLPSKVILNTIPLFVFTR